MLRNHMPSCARGTLGSSPKHAVVARAQKARAQKAPKASSPKVEDDPWLSSGDSNASSSGPSATSQHKTTNQGSKQSSGKATGPTPPKGGKSGPGQGWLRKLTDSKATVLERAAFFDNIIARGTSILESLAEATKNVATPLDTEQEPPKATGTATKSMPSPSDTDSKRAASEDDSMQVEATSVNDSDSPTSAKQGSGASAADSAENPAGMKPTSSIPFSEDELLSEEPAVPSSQNGTFSEVATGPTPEETSEAASQLLAQVEEQQRSQAPPAGVQISFSIAYGTVFGQRLALVGNDDELGHWQVEQCLMMETTDGVIWSASVTQNASSSKNVEYKYLVVNEADKSVVRWQEGDNMKLDLPESCQLANVTDFWDRSISCVDFREAPTLEEPAADVEVEASAAVEAFAADEEDSRVDASTVLDASSSGIGQELEMPSPSVSPDIAEEVEAAARQSNALVRISWSLQYTCNFGEQVALIGRGAPLGDWDVSKSLRLEWTEGDLWSGSAVFDASVTQLEYKFVIIDSASGGVVRWQPGYNCVLDVLETIGLDVFETWDQSGRVLCQHSSISQPTTVALELPHDEDTKPGQGGGQIVLFETSREAMMALDDAIKSHEATLSTLDDPTSLDAILADRRLAESFNNILKYEQKMIQGQNKQDSSVTK